MLNRAMKKISLAAVVAACLTPGLEAQGTTGWLDWRGPNQNGTSVETGLPDTISVEDAKWTFQMRGRGTPVISGGRVYAMAYEGEGPDLAESVICLDAATGKEIWRDTWSDFISDVIYDRYAIGSPTIDPETGEVYIFTTAGILRRYSPDGEVRWETSTMETLGRLTFPNGRTGAPLVVEDLVIMHVINAHWGKTEGPARDRFYAFHKETGEVLWGCTPGVGPKDSSFSHPVLEERGGRLVLYAGTGCGNMVALDARTGDMLWRYQMSIGGVNSSAVIHGDSLIAVHGKENIDSSVIGRMISLPLGTEPEAGVQGPVVLPTAANQWRNDLVAFTSSPVLVGDRVFLTSAHGDLSSIDVATGKILWKEHLAPDQIHASPVAADGKLYVPMTNGTLHVVRPSDEACEVLSSTQLEGSCLGAPAICGGRIYVHTTEKLYCFGEATDEPAWPVARREKAGEVVRVRVVPADVTLQVGESPNLRLQGLDAAGRIVADIDDTGYEFKMAPVLQRDDDGWRATRPGLSLATLSAGDLAATARVRVVSALPIDESFDGYALETPASDGAMSANPPSSWIGVMKKWQVVEHEGQKVLRKSLDNPLFQRAMGFSGHPDMSDYTVTVDIMTDGNRRSMSAAGVVNQRYLVQLIGNYRALQISSNDERIKVRAPFTIKPGVWYRLMTRVDVSEDGSGVVRAKAWPRDEQEPAEWTLEVPHARAHTHGAPGIYGFTPQSRFHVYVDNYTVTPNE